MMQSVNILIKPASSACNMSCEYCFYHDVASSRERYFEGMITDETMEHLIRAGFDLAQKSCTFSFQGGEPTLRGLDFFRHVIALQKKVNVNNIGVHNCIQTNGTLIDEQWAEFFAKHNFLVGLSLDGPASIHNVNRPFAGGKDSYNTIMKTVALFNRYDVQYNILSVVTGRNARAIEKSYNYYKKNNFKWLQFIPCLDPLEVVHGKSVHHLSQKGYTDFLLTLFDLWYDDFIAGNYISIRFIDNVIHMLLGGPPEACSMNGRCSIQFVVEGDGSVYPCDFYVLDEYKLGNIAELTLQSMLDSDVAKRFVADSTIVPQDCKTCDIYKLCRNGCRRDRVKDSDGILKNYYCESYKTFYKERTQKLMHCAKIVAGAR